MIEDNKKIYGVDAVKLAQAETEGFFIKDFPGHVATVRTKRSIYKFIIDENLNVVGQCFKEDGSTPKYLPEPTSIDICGSTWGGSMLKMKYVGVDMFMEVAYGTKDNCSVFTTSRVLSIKLEKI